ncbi:hypothetical protein [Burkholderia ubonensis]|uniref:Uncharacterized protein n=1 Tax=Burkholderia ubonensis subsp. mesacidophila TaxID=265293 RepID=A0A2A4FM79_9BURK|nr:hypothetical protein [Burkholderia ubonensis]PCE33770.1 hypothetical protein BZL54_03345 [Burkholderia ubonensis subsp. mesacidophila]
MTTLSRRDVLMALVAAPVVMLAPCITFGAPHAMTVAEAMRYLTGVVFLSPCEKRNEMHCSGDRRHQKESA